MIQLQLKQELRDYISPLSCISPLLLCVVHLSITFLYFCEKIIPFSREWFTVRNSLAQIGYGKLDIFQISNLMVPS